MRLWQISTVCLGAAAIVGCGGMSANECELADWRAVGYEDGVRGVTSDRFGGYRRECAEYEVAPDFQAWQEGREAGLREYCQPARGFREGSRGRDYQGICPPDLEGPFLVSYEEGRTLYDLEYAVRSTSRKISQHRSRIDAIESELTHMVGDALLGEKTAEERAALIVKTKQLAEERATLSAEIDVLEKRLAEQQDALAAHREQMVTQR